MFFKIIFSVTFLNNFSVTDPLFNEWLDRIRATKKNSDLSKKVMNFYGDDYSNELLIR